MVLLSRSKQELQEEPSMTSTTAPRKIISQSTKRKQSAWSLGKEENSQKLISFAVMVRG
jgi:hypothetical protein